MALFKNLRLITDPINKNNPITVQVGGNLLCTCCYCENETGICNGLKRNICYCNVECDYFLT